MGILNKIVKLMRKSFDKLPDKRSNKHQTYSMADIALSAFSVFYFQSGSWLNFQRNMLSSSGKSNAKSLFDIKNIPSDNHIRNTLDGIDIQELQSIFDDLYTLLLKKKTLDEYQVFDKTIPILLDGTYYHHSKKIYCNHCQTKQKEDTKGKKYIEYYHSAITPIVAHPKSSQILPLLPEMISNKDGNEKQDCEINASKRWLSKPNILSQYYQLLMLGDDLYSKTSFIKDIREKGYNYIFVSKESSHKKMYETIDYIERLGMVDTKVVKKLNKRKKEETYKYKYLNDVNLTGDKDSITVNWCSVEITNENNKIIYSNSFITDYSIDDMNIEKIIQIGRTRWKIENENNNTLKTKGYNLEHNFGHGKEGLSELLFALNILSFFIHTICLKYDDGYKELYELIGNRKTFFNHITTFTTFFYIENFDTLWQIMIKGYTDGLRLK